MNKLGLSMKEVGRLTLTMFNRLYQKYKDNFDLEMMMYHNKKTYKDIEIMRQKDLEWF